MWVRSLTARLTIFCLFILAKHCINTIEELNERIGNLSNALDNFSNYETAFSDDDIYDEDEFEDTYQDVLNQNQENHGKYYLT